MTEPSRRRRWPLWAAFLPVIVAVAGYSLWWTTRARSFEEDAAGWLPAGAAAERSGFPYRVALATGAAERRFAAPGASLQVGAARWSFERQPWRRSLTVAGAETVRISVALADLPAARLALVAPEGRGSVNHDGSVLRRLSVELTGAEIALGLIGVPAEADRLEIHLRETPGRKPVRGSPSSPAQAEVLIRAEGLRLRGGDPLAMEAEGVLTAAAPIRSAAAWLGGGTLELRRLALTDPAGAVATIDATLSPARGEIAMLGTVTTVCPRTIAAAFAGERAPRPEYRARREMRLPFGGAPGTVAVRAALPERFTTRNRETPCPQLVGR